MTSTNPSERQNGTEMRFGIATCSARWSQPRLDRPRVERREQRRAHASASGQRQDGRVADVGRALRNEQRAAVHGASADHAGLSAVDRGDEDVRLVGLKHCALFLAHLRSDIGADIGAKDRRAGVEARLFVDQPVHDVEVLETGHSHVDIRGWIWQRVGNGADGERSAAPEAQVCPRLLDRALARRHVRRVVQDAIANPGVREQRVERAVGVPRVDVRRYGVAVGQHRRRARRGEPRTPRGRRCELSEAEHDADDAVVVGGNHAVAEPRGIAEQLPTLRGVLEGRGQRGV